MSRESSAGRRLVRVHMASFLALAVASLVEVEALWTVVAIALLFLALPLALLAYLDWVSAVRARRPAGTGAGVVLGILALPSFVLGLVALLTGLALITWVLYNLLVERQPEFHGWHLWEPFGIGPALIAAGWAWMRRGLRAEASELDAGGQPATEGEDPE